MPFTYKAAAAGGGAAPELGWRRFLFDGATNEDPHSQTASLVEDGDSTHWTSNTAVTITTGSPDYNNIPNNGSVYIRPLVDGNGDAITWNKPFVVQCRLERVSPTTGTGSVTNKMLYWAFGLTDAASSVASAKFIGQTTSWNSSSQSRHYRTREGSQDNAQNTTLGWDVYFMIVHGPKKNTQASHTQICSYVYDPADPPNNAEANMNTYNIGSQRITGAGPVYAFGSVGCMATTSVARSGKFRIWYQAAASGLEWII